MLRSYCSGKLSPLEVIAERELIYRLLAQTTPETLHKNVQKYSIDPKSRYPSLESNPAQHVHQVRHLCESDVFPSIDFRETSRFGAEGKAPLTVAHDFDFSVGTGRKTRPLLIPSGTPDRSLMEYVEKAKIIRWCQLAVQPYRLRVDNLSVALHSGLVIGAIINRFRPELLDYNQLSPTDTDDNWGKISKVCRNELHIESCPLDANLLTADDYMLTFITEIYETFRERRVTLTALPHSKSSTLNGRVAQSPTSGDLNSLNGSLMNAVRMKRKLSRELPEARLTEFQRPNVDLGGGRIESDAEREERYRKRLEDVDRMFKQEKRPALGKNYDKPIDKISEERLKQVERLIEEQLPNRIHEVKQKKPQVKARKFDAAEIKNMEAKLQDSIMGKLLFKVRSATLLVFADANLLYAFLGQT